MPASASACAGDPPRHLPDLVGVVLDPAGPREVLLELAVGAAGDPRPRGRRRGRWCRSSPGRSRGSRGAATLSAARAIGAHEVAQLAPRGGRSRRACGRWRGARGRARSRARRSRRAPRRSSSRSPSRSRRRTAARARRTLGAHRPLARDRRLQPRRRSGARSPSAAKPSAMPKPPPTRRAKAATARSHSPGRDRVDQRREARRRLAEVGVAQQHHLIVGGPLARAPPRRRR